MSTSRTLYKRLAAAASLEGDEAGIRIRASYEPVGGWGEKVFPPTYPRPGGQRGESVYLIEQRYRDGEAVDVAMLDAAQSQANRCEEALQEAIDSSTLSLPLLLLEAAGNSEAIRITSLQAPHRSRDAYFRDSVLAGSDPAVRFDDSPAGRALAEATDRAALAYYLHAPVDLVFGSWDSHRGKRRAVRFPRVYSSEVIGWRPHLGRRGGGRMDPVVLPGDARIKVRAGDPAGWETTTDGKGDKKLSELGHGMIPPSLNGYVADELLAGGGVSVEAIERVAHLSFAGLARIVLAQPGNQRDPQTEKAGRAVLAALALLADRLTFARPAVFLRSGCDLALKDESLEWVMPGGDPEPLSLDRQGARELFDYAVAKAEEAGLRWDTEPVRLAPAANLAKVIEQTLATVDLDVGDE